jgi:hypothetical protein
LIVEVKSAVGVAYAFRILPKITEKQGNTTPFAIPHKQPRPVNRSSEVVAKRKRVA